MIGCGMVDRAGAKQTKCSWVETDLASKVVHPAGFAPKTDTVKPTTASREKVTALPWW